MGIVADRLPPENVLVARLAAGPVGTLKLPAEPVDWARVLETAVRERCASLIWLHNAAVIRAMAPADIAARWRGRTLAAGVAAREQLAELGEVVGTLDRVGVTPIVLKGLPLGVMLHGDVAARPVNDIDLFIPVSQREAAHEELCRAGFRHRYGLAPEEGAYERVRDGRRSVLEVHSSLLDADMLAHLRLPAPEGVAVDLEGVHVYAQRGPLLPLFLAMHLAKHTDVPLLWWIDLAVAWRAQTPAERAETRRLAAVHRVERFLAWAERGIALFETASAAELDDARDALASLMDLHGHHPARRLPRLSATLLDAARSVGAWAWPRSLRRRPLAFAWQSAIRAVAVLRRRLDRGSAVPDVQAAPATELRALAISEEQLLGLVRDVVGAGAPLWVRARGSSMHPTVKDGALVRLVPLPERPLRRGDVVFAIMRGGNPVIHRVREVAPEQVTLQGDNMLYADAPLAAGDVIALADTVQQDTRASAIPGRAPFNPSLIAARWRSMTRRRRLQHVDAR